jgi:hypothetical protein
MRGRNYSLCSTLGLMRRFWVYRRETGTYAIVEKSPL